MARDTTGVTAADRDRLALHQSVAAAFTDATDLAGTTETTVRIGHELVRIRTAGDALLQPLTRALAHLRVEPGTPATATIDAWDSATTGRPLPVLVDRLLQLLDLTWLEDRDIRGELRAFNEGPVRAAFYGPQLLSVYDVERRAGVFWLRDATALPWYESGAPLRVLFDWIMASPTRQLLHAGAVAGPSGGVVLGGAGGAGKSTAALACVGYSTFHYLSDDYVVLDVESEPTVASIYSTAKLKSLSDLERFEPFRASIVNRERAAARADEPSDAEKPMLFLHEHAPERIATSAPVRALVFPRYIATDDCEVVSLSADAAFRLLVPSTLQQAPSARGEALRCMRVLTQRVPAFGLGLPTDARKIPSAVCAILSEVS